MAGSTIYLSQGDGATSGALQLTGGSDYALRWNPFDLGNSAATGGGGSARSQRNRLRTISLPLTILGTSSDDLWSNVDAVIEKLDQARHAIERGGYSDRVTLSVKLGGTTWVYWDLLLDDDGEPGLLVLPDDAHMQAAFLNRLECTLTLNVRGVGRGDPVAVAGSSSITNGTASVYQLGDVPGHYPALCRLAIADLSTNSKVINRLTIGQRRAPSLASGDFTPVLALDGTGTSDTTALGGAYHRVTATSSWQSVGSVAQPVTAPLTRGELDVWAMVRDSTTVIGTPSGLSAKAGMALVQHASAVANTPSDGALGAQWNRATTPGSLLVLSFASQTGGGQAPDGWTLAWSATNTGGGVTTVQWYKADAPSESGIVTVQCGSTSPMAIAIAEYQGFTGVASPLDQSNSSGGSLTQTTKSTGSTGTTAQANELACAAVGSVAFDNTAETVNSWSNSFTEREDTGIIDTALAVADRFLSATGTYSTTATFSATSYAAAGITTYKANGPTGSLSGDTYTFHVAAVDASGNVGLASSSVEFLMATTSSIVLAWTAPTAGATVDHYRIFYERGGSWKYIDTTDDSVTYTFTSETGAVATTEPAAGTSIYGAFRLRYGLAGDTITTPGAGMSTQVADSTWELLYLGTVPLPPLNAQERRDPHPWKLTVEAKHPLGLSSTLDCCGVWLIPSTMEGEPQLLMEYVDEDGDTGTLATRKRWVYDLARDGGQGVTLDGTPVALTAGGSPTVNGDGSVTISGSTDVVTVPASTLDETQGWVAFRVTLPDATTVTSCLWAWFDNSSNIFYLYWNHGNVQWEAARASAGTFDELDVAGTLADGDTVTVVMAWTSTALKLSIDGAAFTSLASTHIPTLAATTWRLGNDNNVFSNGPFVLSGDVHWALAGTGTLTDADAAALHASGDADPAPSRLGSAAVPTLRWAADSTAHASDGSALSQAQTVVGELAVGPGPATLVIMPEIGDGAVDVVDCKFAVGAALTPLYQLPPGA